MSTSPQSSNSNDDQHSNVVGANGQSTEQSSTDLMGALRAVNDAFSISGSQWDDQLMRVINSLNLPAKSKRRLKKSEEQENTTEAPPIDVDSLKMAASIILFSSTSHLSNLSGVSRFNIERLIRQTAVLASQSENDSLRTVIGKSQSRLVKKLKNSDLSSVTICVGTFIKLLALSRDLEVLLSNTSIQTALIETLTLMNDFCCLSTKIAAFTKLALSSPSMRSLLVSTLTKQNSSKSISPTLIKIVASIVEAVHQSERRTGVLLTRSDSLRSIAQRKGLSSKDVGTALTALQTAWTVCLETKPPLPLSIVKSFDPFFRCLTSDDVTNSPVNLLQNCSRHIRRTPDASLPTLSHLFREVTMDLSSNAPALLSETGLLECLKSDKPALQQVGREFLMSLISQVSDPNAIAQCLRILYEPLQKGQVVKAHEKLGLIEAFHAATLSRYVDCNQLAEVLPQFFNASGYFVAKGPTKAELQENIRHAALQVTGRYLQICGINDSTAKDICELYRTLLTDTKLSDRLRHSVISALSLALDRPLDSDRIDFQLLRPSIEAIISLLPSQATKPTARLMCLESLLFLMRVERLHPLAFSSHISTTSLRPLISNSDSFFNSITLIGKAPANELSVHFQILCLMFSLPSLTPLGLPILTSDPLSQSMTLISQSVDPTTTPNALPFPPIDHADQDKHFASVFRSFISIVTALYERNLWSVDSETLSDMCHSNVVNSNVSTSGRLNLRTFLHGFGNAPELLRLISRGCYELLTEMTILQTKLRQPSKDWDKDSPNTLFVDSIPSPSSFRRSFKAILNSLSDCQLDPNISDDTPTLLSLCCSHPLVDAIKISQLDINTTRFVDHFMMHHHHQSADSSISSRITLGPNLNRLPELLSYLNEVDPTFDTSGFRSAFVSLLAIADPKISLQLEQNQQSLPFGFSHNEIIDCCQKLGPQLVDQLPTESLTSLTTQDIQLYFAPEGVLFIEEGVYIAQEVENKNIKLNKYQKELYGDATAEVMKASAAAKAKVAPKAKAKAGAGAKEANKTKSDIEKEEIESQTRRRYEIRREVRQLEFIMNCIGTMAIVHPSGIQQIMPIIVQKLVESFKCPLSFSGALHLTRILCHEFIPATLLPTPHRVPDAFYCAALKRLPVQNENVEMLKEVSSSSSLSRPAALLIQPIISFILQHPAETGPKCCLAALEFMVKQLKTDDPQLSADASIICIGSVLRNQPGRIALGSVALDAICSKLLEESLVPLVANIGMSDDPAIRFAVVSALRRSRCTLNGANAFLYCCKFDTKQAKTVEVADASREAFGLFTTVEMLNEIETFLSCESDEFREMVAVGFARAAKELRELGMLEISPTLHHLVDGYIAAKQLNQRVGYISTLTQISKNGLITTEDDFKALFKFVIGWARNLIRKLWKIVCMFLRVLLNPVNTEPKFFILHK